MQKKEGRGKGGSEIKNRGRIYKGCRKNKEINKKILGGHWRNE